MSFVADFLIFDFGALQFAAVRIVRTSPERFCTSVCSFAFFPVLSVPSWQSVVKMCPLQPLNCGIEVDDAVEIMRTFLPPTVFQGTVSQLVVQRSVSQPVSPLAPQCLQPKLRRAKKQL